MNIFEIDFKNDFNYMLSTIGQRIKINNKEETAMITTIKDRSIDYKTIRTNFPICSGDIVEYQNSKWLITSQVRKTDTYSATLQKLELSFKKIIDNQVYEIPCIIECGNQGIQSSQFINVVDGDIKVIVQDNEITRKITYDNRFIKMGAAWKVTGFTAEISGLRFMYCKKDTFNNATDNKELEIADYNIINSSYSITIAEGNNINLTKGNTLQLHATLKDGDGKVLDSSKLKFESLNTSICTVSNTGLLTAISTGTVSINISYFNYSNPIMVTVSISVTDVQVTNYSVVLSTSNGKFEVRTGMTKEISVKFYRNGVETAIQEVIWKITSADGVGATNLATIKLSDSTKCIVLGNDNVKLTGYFLLNVESVDGAYKKSVQMQLKTLSS